jgi:hypothetical protein
MQRPKINHHGEKGDNLNLANTRHLSRILLYLREVKYSHYKKIEKDLGIGNRTKDALIFLVKHKLIKKIERKRGSSFHYCLPENESEVQLILRQSENKYHRDRNGR